ncbi:hypothetical protein FPANT_10716 [Fusarium pseudoanthophilum]|uniref:Uncharacterized protein n=1 Tax=Fusarium pseudoanthophilum TaxID=48495 RepID=A0A8H5KMA6_9HYPO|nr:hypothetical protein FPANT_10716 [Fusarium pseudoanthophilum]
MLRLSKKWFIEFMEDEHPGIDAQAEFFAPDSNEPDHVLLKEYSQYPARSRVGKIGDTLKVNTVIGHISCLLWSMERESNRSYNSDIRKQMGFFISNNLAVQEGLTTEAKPKLLASSKDVSFIVSKLYEPEYLGTFGSMRAVLNLTLYMMLVIDTCGRGGEFARKHVRPEHMCLRWEEAQFYCFPFEDTLRLLINTALFDRVFSESTSSWNDLSEIRLPSHIAKTGRRIQLKEEPVDVPVLRRMIHHNLTKDPSKWSTSRHKSPDLDNAINVSDDLRTFLMGHKPGNNTYARHYQARVSTVDFSSMFRGLDQVSTLPQGSVLLNRSDNAPIKLSPEGLARVLALPDVVKGDKKLASSREKILEEYLSIKKARQHASLLAAQYDDTTATRRSCIDYWSRRYYEDGYKEHFANLRATTRPSIPVHDLKPLALRMTLKFLCSSIYSRLSFYCRSDVKS